MVRRLLLAAVVTLVVPLAAMLAPSAANAASTTGCVDGIAVSQFAFSPPSVPVGGSSDLTLVLQNCTNQTIQGGTAWNGLFIGPDCPAFDGIFNPYTIAPGGTYTLTNTEADPGSPCQPTSLQMSANVYVTGVSGVVTIVAATLLFDVPCTDGLAISELSVSPPSVPVGQTSRVVLILQNCTSQAVQGSGTWTPAFTWAGTGQPPGCPALDPVAFNYSIAPEGATTAAIGLGDPVATCQATGIQATVNVAVNGFTGTAVTGTANLVITQPPPSDCQVSYTPSNWQGGFTASVTISDTSSSAINDWTLTFTFPGDQKITSAWNAAVTQSGSSVTATNESYNATIAPGGSQSFGFQGTWTANDTSPTSFSVNGMTCT